MLGEVHARVERRAQQQHTGLLHEAEQVLVRARVRDGSDQVPRAAPRPREATGSKDRVPTLRIPNA